MVLLQRGVLLAVVCSELGSNVAAAACALFGVRPSLTCRCGCSAMRTLLSKLVLIVSLGSSLVIRLVLSLSLAPASCDMSRLL